MTFTIRPYLKYLLPILILFGVVFLGNLVMNSNQETENQKESLLFLIPIVVVVFFLLPLLTFKYFKIITRKNEFGVGY